MRGRTPPRSAGDCGSSRQSPSLTAVGRRHDAAGHRLNLHPQPAGQKSLARAKIIYLNNLINHICNSSSYFNLAIFITVRDTFTDIIPIFLVILHA